MFGFLEDAEKDVASWFGGGAPAAQGGPAPAPTPAPAPAPAPAAAADPAQAAAALAHYADGAAPAAGAMAGASASGSASASASAQPRGLLDSVYHDLTDWHFEGRTARNGAPPTDAELHDPKGGWEQLPASMAIYHDNHVGLPEKKFVNPDGRESVRDGDTGQEVTDPRYMATYNYVTPMAPADVHGVGDAAEFAVKGLGHLAADVLPYYIGGNVRGPG